MNSKGEFNWAIIVWAPALIILFLISFAILDPITEAAFTAIDSSGSSFMPDLVKLAIGAIGFVLAAGVLWNISHRTSGPTGFNPPV